MKKLRELRTAANYTQGELARMLKVSQQTIARWEAGKTEPNIAALHDIAVIFGTSVDDLLGIEKNRITKITTSDYHLFASKTSDGFWGDLGLLLPDHKKTKWYPITIGEADRLRSILSDCNEYNQDWLVVSTLNNRMLVFKISAIKQIFLLNDAVDQPMDDWDISWDISEIYSPEIYRALEEYFYNSKEKYIKKYSKTLREIVKNLLKKYEIDEEKLVKLVLDTYIHFVDGTSINYSVESQHLESVVCKAEQTEDPSFFRLDSTSGIESYFPATAICLVDMPLLKYHEGRKKIYEENQ